MLRVTSEVRDRDVTFTIFVDLLRIIEALSLQLEAWSQFLLVFELSYGRNCQAVGCYFHLRFL